jgi:hypothetical protein
MTGVTMFVVVSVVEIVVVMVVETSMAEVMVTLDEFRVVVCAVFVPAAGVTVLQPTISATVIIKPKTNSFFFMTVPPKSNLIILAIK